jgi:hypothetical protein
MPLSKSNAENGITTSKYIRNKFDFFGIKLPNEDSLKTIWKKERKRKKNKQKLPLTQAIRGFLILKKKQRIPLLCNRYSTKELNNYKKGRC